MTRRRTKRIWYTEPCDLQAGADNARTTWQKLFGEVMELKKAVENHDGGDYFIYYMPNGYAYTIACDHEAIHQYEEVL